MCKSVLGAILSAVLLMGCGGDDCTPTTEVCDNLDNDCNGAIDDSLQRICQTACGMGVETCSAGVWAGCTARQPGVESCNGMDDDCDGCFDEKPEGTGCAPLEQACSTACGNGLEYCYMGQWQGCTAQVPGDEVCDGVDNDCDTQTDEGLDADVDGDGHYAVGSCHMPNDDCVDNDNTVYPGHAETCDTKDNNCNAQIDEGCACTPPASQACGSDVGECTVGTQDCQPGGAWGVCHDGNNQPVLLPGQVAEECDGLDNNCDGQPDENNPEGGGECGTDEGLCTKGTERCVGGQLVCQGGVTPVNEECDGLDNNCDGQTDNGLAADSFEGNDTCSLARVLQDPVIEGDLPVQIDKTLYKTDGTADTDWLKVTAEEAFHWCTPGDDQCYDFVLYFSPPAGSDPSAWQICLHADSCASFPDASLTFCTAYPGDWYEASGHYALGVMWGGTCGIDDSYDFYLVVRSSDAQHPVSSCQNYSIEMGMSFLGNEACQ